MLQVLGEQVPALKFARCASCGRAQVVPLPACATCASVELVPATSKGFGTVITYTRVFHQFRGSSPRLPYYVIVVRLDEGPRILGILMEPADPLRVGARVRYVHDEKAFGPEFAVMVGNDAVEPATLNGSTSDG